MELLSSSFSTESSWSGTREAAESPGVVIEIGWKRERERRGRIERNWFFSIFLYHYLNKKGYSYTAQIFRYEVQITQQTPPGMYASFWEMNYFLKLKKRSCVLQEKKYLIHKTITLPFL
jgi:hypothetical protein